MPNGQQALKRLSRPLIIVVVQLFSCVWLCDSMDYSMPGIPVVSTRVCWNWCQLRWWYHPTIPSCATLFSSCPQSFPPSGSLPMSWLFASNGQSIGASASASVLAVNIQGWFLLGLTGLISLLSKGPSRVFSSTSFHQYFGSQWGFIEPCPFAAELPTPGWHLVLKNEGTLGSNTQNEPFQVTPVDL